MRLGIGRAAVLTIASRCWPGVTLAGIVSVKLVSLQSVTGRRDRVVVPSIVHAALQWRRSAGP